MQNDANALKNEIFATIRHTKRLKISVCCYSKPILSFIPGDTW